VIYLDTSAFLDRHLGQNNFAAIDEVVVEADRTGTPRVSSRLLHLEARRAQIRDSLVWEPVVRELETVELLPLDEDVWRAAHDIRVHVRTLDALHLATCSLVGATLLASDARMVAAATELGIPTIDLES
jgi:uncharacterized protein